MTAGFAFETWRDAAHRLREAAISAGVELHPLPYRRFEPEADDTWWLAPTTDNPAYADGKIVLEGPSPQDRAGPLIGLHIEKGLGPAAAEMFLGHARGRRLVMNDGWIWRAFNREMATGRVDHELAAAVRAAGPYPVLVTVVSAVQGLPRLDQTEDRERDRAKYVWFEPTGDGLRHVDHHQPGELARKVADRETLASLATKIASLDDVDWRWVELLIGVPFERVATGGLKPDEVWRRACAPWTSWLR